MNMEDTHQIRKKQFTNTLLWNIPPHNQKPSQMIKMLQNKLWHKKVSVRRNVIPFTHASLSPYAKAPSSFKNSIQLFLDKNMSNKNQRNYLSEQKKKTTLMYVPTHRQTFNRMQFKTPHKGIEPSWNDIWEIILEHSDYRSIIIKLPFPPLLYRNQTKKTFITR